MSEEKKITSGSMDKGGSFTVSKIETYEETTKLRDTSINPLVLPVYDDEHITVTTKESTQFLRLKDEPHESKYHQKSEHETWRTLDSRFHNYTDNTITPLLMRSKSERKEGVVLEFTNVRLKSKEKLILQGVTGFCEPGTFLALMGPSGSGKSSLLNCLCGRNQMTGKAKISGSITYNGKTMCSKNKHLLAYVLQEDILFDQLTVGETMHFYGRVCLPDVLTGTEKDQRVYDVLKILDLVPSLDKNVGNSIDGGLSPGERKRVSIAIELISDPALIFLDEPTSSLDSGVALSLVRSLKKLAIEENKTIIASIHQPSSQIFHSFDTLLLLSYGQTMYFGPVNCLMDFFDNMGEPCYPNWNLSDYMVELARSNESLRLKMISGCLEKCIFKAPDRKPIKRKSGTNIIKKRYGFSDKIHKSAHQGTSFGNQVMAIARRNFVLSLTEMLNIITIMEAVIIAIISGLVFFQVSFTEKNYISLLSLIYYAPARIFFTPFSNSVFSSFKNHNVIVKERQASMYLLSSYYLAKYLSEIPSVLFFTTIFFTIYYFLVGLSLSAWFLVSLFHVWLVAIVGMVTGLMFSSIGLGFAETGILTSVYMSLAIMLGGVFNRNLPAWLSWARYLNPVFQGYSIFLEIQLRAFGGVICHTESRSDSYFSSCQNGHAHASNIEVFKRENIQLTAEGILGVMLALAGFYMLLTYFGFKRSLKRDFLSTDLNIMNITKKSKNTKNKI